MKWNLNILLVVAACLLSVASCFLTPIAEPKPADALQAKGGPMCKPHLCPDAEVHVGCFNAKQFGRKCKKNTHVIHVNGGLKLAILERINLLRNYVASGVGHLKVAARMPTMGWDYNLQRLADLQARQCDDGSKFCANTDSYNYVATIEIKSTIANHANVEAVIVNKFLPELFLDVMGCRMDEEGRMVPKKQGSCVGHYAPLIEDRGNRMGCAIRLQGEEPKPGGIRYGPYRFPNMTLLCHFSRANVNSLKHYEVSQYAGDKCITGSSQVYAYLCSPQEDVDANELIDDTMPPVLPNNDPSYPTTALIEEKMAQEI